VSLNGKHLKLLSLLNAANIEMQPYRGTLKLTDVSRREREGYAVKIGVKDKEEFTVEF